MITALAPTEDGATLETAILAILRDAHDPWALKAKE
jgi:hypothetical protein